MSTDNNTEATTERREIDPVFKEVVVYDFGQLNLPVQTDCSFRGKVSSVFRTDCWKGQLVLHQLCFEA